MIKSVIVFFIISFSCLASINEKVLTLDMVHESSLKNYPLILGSIENIEVAKMKVKESLGQFDLTLNSKLDSREKGYYDGKSADITLEKPLGFMNSKIYTGYRISDGTYPLYEGKNNTLDSGESRIGVELSLWRNRDIDEKRLKLWNNQLNVSTKEQKFLSNKVKIEKESTKAYWKWVTSGHIYLVYLDLLEVAIKRDNGLNRRIQKGDLAKIYASENQQYILKRKTQVLEAKRDFYEASLLLSLFLRNEEGHPVIPLEEQLPKSFKQEAPLSIVTLNNDLERARKLSPVIRNLDLKRQQLSNEEMLGQTKISPKLDLNFEVSRDNGRGSSALEQEENRIFLKIEIPIERRLARGKIEKARAQKRVVSYQQQLTLETMEANLKSLFQKLNTSSETILNTTKEVELAQILEKAENRKFSRGASDFFVVNLREQASADAKVKNMKARYEYNQNLAEYKAMTFALIDEQ